MNALKLCTALQNLILALTDKIFPSCLTSPSAVERAFSKAAYLNFFELSYVNIPF